MSDTDPRLVHCIVAAIRDVRSLGRSEGWEPTDEQLAQEIVDSFAVKPEWQSLAHDDVNGSYEDELSKVYESDTALLAAFGPKVADPYRRLRHRFVLTTDWEEVTARLDWEGR